MGTAFSYLGELYGSHKALENTAIYISSDLQKSITALHSTNKHNIYNMNKISKMLTSLQFNS